MLSSGLHYQWKTSQGFCHTYKDWGSLVRSEQQSRCIYSRKLLVLSVICWAFQAPEASSTVHACEYVRQKPKEANHPPNVYIKVANTVPLTQVSVFGLPVLIMTTGGGGGGLYNTLPFGFPGSDPGMAVLRGLCAILAHTSLCPMTLGTLTTDGKVCHLTAQAERLRRP